MCQLSTGLSPPSRSTSILWRRTCEKINRKINVASRRYRIESPITLEYLIPRYERLRKVKWDVSGGGVVRKVQEREEDAGGRSDNRAYTGGRWRQSRVAGVLSGASTRDAQGEGRALQLRISHIAHCTGLSQFIKSPPLKPFSARRCAAYRRGADWRRTDGKNVVPRALQLERTARRNDFQQEDAAGRLLSPGRLQVWKNLPLAIKLNALRVRVLTTDRSRYALQAEAVVPCVQHVDGRSQQSDTARGDPGNNQEGESFR